MSGRVSDGRKLSASIVYTWFVYRKKEPKHILSQLQSYALDSASVIGCCMIATSTCVNARRL